MTIEDQEGWGDMMEEVEGDFGFPPQKEVIEGDIKKIISYEERDEAMVKVTRYYKLTKVKVPKAIAERKKWTKFGNCFNDASGINPANSMVGDAVFLTLATKKDQQEKKEEDVAEKMAKLKSSGQGMVVCRICKGPHWTKQCPYKDTLGAAFDVQQEEQPTAKPPPRAPGAYMPPSIRRGETNDVQTRQRDENPTIRVSNLAEETSEPDLQDLFKPFGTVSRIYLAKDKNTGISKGFAYVTYNRRESADQALQTLHRYRYGHLILQVEWAKPSGS